MKKIFSMFAFVAIMVLGAVTLASCDKNDATDTGVNDKHNYTFKGELSSEAFTKAQLEMINEKTQQLIESNPTFKPITCTEGEASVLWYNIETQGNSIIQKLVDESAKELNDPSLTYTIKMLQDGKDCGKQKTWKVSPLLFL